MDDGPWSSIIETYPALFAQLSSPRSISCSSGWCDIISALSHDLTLLVAMSGLDPQHYQYTCIKEKFGTLRVYMTASTDEMNACVRAAEDKAAEVCEQCGGEGNMYREGWLRTSCEECQEKWRVRTGRRRREREAAAKEAASSQRQEAEKGRWV